MLKMTVAAAGGALLLGAVAARPASAMTDDVIVKAHVSFPFEVLGERMPAGDYEVKAMDVNQPGLLEIRSEQVGGPAMVVLASPRASGEVTHAQMLFDDVGQDKFLRAIVLPDREGVQLPVSQAEVLAAHEVAAKAVKARSHS